MSVPAMLAIAPNRTAISPIWLRQFVQFVMPGLVPGNHVLTTCGTKDVDGRDKPGHDEEK
jgi:Sec-independent protein secretion pathway component TatC